MPTVALTDRFCATAKPIGAKRTDYFDTTARGLALRVTEHGHRSWCFHYRSPRDGKRARATIGTYPATGLAAARGKALEARGHVDEGRDPRLVLAGQGAADMTIAGLVESFLADPQRAALRSKAEIERRLRRNVLPLIGAVKITELRRRDLRTVTDAMLRRGVKVEATRVFEDVRGMVRWAVQNEYLDANPLDGMVKPAEATSSNRVLSDDEIRTLWNGLPKALAKSVQCQRIVKLCLVTGQRVGEVAGMTRAELDLKAREWRLPSARTKNAAAHTVPISDLALAIIKEAMTDAGESGAVFPCGTGSLSPVVVARTILRANKTNRFGIASWSAHDLRRTAITEMARLGIPPIVLGHVANHRTTTRAGITLAVYSLHTYGPEKTQALELWAARLEAIVGEGAAAVVPMRGQAMTLSPKAQELLRKWGLDPSDPVTAEAFAKLPPKARKLLGKLPFGRRRKKDKDKVFAAAFVGHGKKNPEGGIRHKRQAEYAEVAMKTLYPADVPDKDSLSDNALRVIVNLWLIQNTDWWVTKDGVLKRGEVSRRTVGRVRKLCRD